MSNVKYRLLNHGKEVVGRLKDGTEFLVDAVFLPLIKDINFYRSSNTAEDRKTYIIDRHGKKLHAYLMPRVDGYEIDHINLDTFDNRMKNLRLVTHQQNQCNQPLQRNNTSGVSGVSFCPTRNKYRARIKIGQQEIHLGYYETFIEAVQARNVGMKCMFGEYGRYNAAPPAPKWIKEKVINQCKRFAELSLCKAFLLQCKEVETDGA